MLLKRDFEPGWMKMPTESTIKTDLTSIDSNEKSKLQNLGNIGEDLVRLYEISYLKSIGRDIDAEKVRLTSGQEAFDILSFDENGQEKYIEVKTTLGGADTPFFISKNSYDMMQRHPTNYWIYRLYNFDLNKNVAEYFQVSSMNQDKLIIEPLQFKVSISTNK